MKNIRNILSGNLIETVRTNNSVVLPIWFPAPIISYLNYANLLSMLLTEEKTYDWIFSHFINIYSMQDHWCQFQFVPDSYGSVTTGIFWENFMINSDFISMDKESIVDKMISWLDNEYYIEVLLAEYEIPGTAFYKKILYPHWEFIFGYDKDRKIFKFHNYNSNEQLDVIDVTFDDFKNALFSKNTQFLYDNYNWEVTKKNFCFRFFKLRKDSAYEYQMDLNHIRGSYKNYLSGEDLSPLLKLQNPEISHWSDKQIYWGISVYQFLINYIQDYSNQNNGYKKLDYRIYHSLWEHKKMLLMRTHYLKDFYNILHKDIIYNDIANLIKLTNRIRFLILKLQMSSEANLVSRVVDLLNECQEKDAKLVADILNDI